MTFQEAYLEIKKKFDNADASKVADFAIQIHLTDEDCHGTMYAEVKDGKLSVEPFDYNDRNLHIEIAKANLISALGRSSLDKMIADGKAEVYGDVAKFADLKSTIKKAAAPAKKAAPVKKAAAPAKKAAAPAKKAAAPAKKAAAPAKKAAAPAKKAAPVAKKAAPAAKKTETKTTAKKN